MTSTSLFTPTGPATTTRGLAQSTRSHYKTGQVDFTLDQLGQSAQRIFIPLSKAATFLISNVFITPAHLSEPFKNRDTLMTDRALLS